MRKPDRSSYTPVDFRQWSNAGSLVISPKFQRRGVWSRAARSYLIDTLLMGLPVPPLYMRVVQSPDGLSTVREIVDGQQRLSAVLDYIDGKYSLAKNIESPCVGKRFADLTDEEKSKISQYPFICEVFYGVEDSEILGIFARLNMHSVKLNAQELRNGKYFGPFKRLAYGLAFEHLEFWRKHKVFSETAIARMQEVELTSELMIVEIAGLQDKKKSISDFYGKYDEEFPEAGQVAARFRAVLDVINEALSESLGRSEFRRTPLFYSLFGAVYHRLYGVPKVTLPSPATGRLTREDIEGLDSAVRMLSEVVVNAKEENDIPKQFETFVSACLRQTDNVRPRQIRLETIYRAAFE